METNDFEKYVRQRCQELEVSLSFIAKKSDMSRPNLYKLLSGSAENARISTLVKLAHALQSHPMILIRHMFEQTDFPLYSNCLPIEPYDASGFIRDVTIPDNTIVKAGQRFIKTWEVQNTGQIQWSNRFLRCLDKHIELISCNPDFQPPMIQRCLIPTENKVAIADLAPGESGQISVEFTAPNLPGSCISYWKMSDQEGNLFFPAIEGLSCLVQVLYI